MTDRTSKTLEPGLVRLRVNYSSIENLLSEWSRNIGRETVVLTSAKPMPPGSLFVVYLNHEAMEEPLEIHAEVIQVTPRPQGNFVLHLHYRFPRHQKLEPLKTYLHRAQHIERQRRHVRIPFCMQATEDSAYSPLYWIHNLSLGGVRIEVDAPQFISGLEKGSACLIRFQFGTSRLDMPGRIAWLSAPTHFNERPSLGIQFHELEADTHHVLQNWVLNLVPPARPWKAWLQFNSAT